MFSTVISLGFLWINFFFFYFSATTDSPTRFFFSRKGSYSCTWDALVCICFMTFWHIFGDLWPVTCDLWTVTCDLWPVTCDLWPVTCDLWPVKETCRRTTVFTSASAPNRTRACLPDEFDRNAAYIPIHTVKAHQLNKLEKLMSSEHRVHAVRIFADVARGNGVRNSRNVWYFRPTTQYVHVCWNFTSVFSSLLAPVWVK